MADVKIRIEVNPNAESEVLGDIQNQINNTASSDNISNVSVKTDSIGIFQNIPSLSGGINGLSLAQDLIFDENGYVDNEDLQGGVLESTENPVEFIWGAVPESKEYSVKLVFTNAQNLKDIIVYGDSVVNQFPTQAIIDGSKTIYNDDLQWAINLQEESETHTIEFTHWNRVNYNACLSYIAVMMKYLDIDKYTGLKSVESLSQSSSDTTGIFYGVLENSGSLELLDRTGELDELLSDGVIDNSNTKVEIIANRKSVQHHISTDSSYDRNTKLISLELGNRFNSLDILKYKGYDYPDHSERLSVLFFDILSNLRYALFGTDKPLTEEEFKEMLSAKYNSLITLYDYLYSIEVQYPVIEANKTYREVIDEFCLIAQMQMYIDDDNNVKFVSARPKYFSEELQAIHIPKKNMFSQFDYAVILKNKYDGVEASKVNVIDEINPNTSVFSSNVISLENKSLADYPYITDSELYTRINGVFNYSQNSSGNFVNYICHKYYYENFQFEVPKKKNQNLEQVKSIKNYLTSDSSKSYNLTYTKTTSRIGASYSSGKISNLSRWQIPDPEYNPNFSVEEGNGLIDGAISYEQLKLDDEDASNVTILSEDDNYYYVDVKVCVSLEKFWLWVYVGSGQITETSRGEFVKYIPKSLSLDIYGEKRTISFEQVQSNTENIDLSKTKVSLGSSTLIQSDNVIDTIKNNIITDYKQGISNANVSISCNDYFDNNGKKVINWTNGEIPQVNQVVYFDNDLYKDQSQRYWKIKGRNFRKTGVPMVDLELEETFLSSYNFDDYTWEDIARISESGMASQVFKIGDTKRLNSEYFAKVIGFNRDVLLDDSKAGITFMIEPIIQPSSVPNIPAYMDSSNSLDIDWSNCSMRTISLPLLKEWLSNISSEIVTHIKPVKKVTGNLTTTDDLWLLSVDEIEDDNQKYEWFFNIEAFLKQQTFWTRTMSSVLNKRKFVQYSFPHKTKGIVSPDNISAFNICFCI